MNPPKTGILDERVDLPAGVSLRMCEAGMREWDAAHKSGERHWPNMLARVFVAMRDAA